MNIPLDKYFPIALKKWFVSIFLYYEENLEEQLILPSRQWQTSQRRRIYKILRNEFTRWRICILDTWNEVEDTWMNTVLEKADMLPVAVEDGD